MLQIHKTVTSLFRKTTTWRLFLSFPVHSLYFLFLSLFFFCVFDYKWNRVLISSVGSKKSRRREDRLGTVCGCYWGALHSAFLYFFFLMWHAIPILCHIVLSVHSCTFPTMLITSPLYVFLDWRDEFIHVMHATYPMSRFLVPCPVLHNSLLVELPSSFRVDIVRLAGCFIQIQMKKERKKESHGASKSDH
jgi:hypothetical protein